MIEPLTAPDALENLDLLVMAVRRNQDRDGLADDFFRRIAEEPLCSPVPSRDDAVEVFAQDRVIEDPTIAAS
jgi:hypothetical protein